MCTAMPDRQSCSSVAMRQSEVAGLNYANNLHHGLGLVGLGKGNMERLVYIQEMFKKVFIAARTNSVVNSKGRCLPAYALMTISLLSA